MPLQPTEPKREYPVYAKISGLRAALSCKCPRCRVGRMFSHGTYNLAKFSNMNAECPHCKQDFRIEPGFYFGAAYVSYGMNAVIVLIAALIYFTMIPDFEIWAYIAMMVGAIILVVPIIFRQSRSIWLHLVGSVKFEQKYLNTVDVKNLMVKFGKEGKSVT